jgi:hypothetical protein
MGSKVHREEDLSLELKAMVLFESLRRYGNRCARAAFRTEFQGVSYRLADLGSSIACFA